MVDRADFTDIISINSLQVSANIGPDWWGRDRHQPIIISVHLYLKHLQLEKAGDSDDVGDSVHYGHLDKSINKLVNEAGAKFDGLRGLARAVVKAAFALAGDAVEQVKVVVEAPKLCLMADAFGVEIIEARPKRSESRVFVKGLTLAAIIGINPPERESKQRVIFDISFFEYAIQTSGKDNYNGFISRLCRACHHLLSKKYLSLTHLHRRSRIPSS
jgi:FolB domain-containing protein